MNEAQPINPMNEAQPIQELQWADPHVSEGSKQNPNRFIACAAVRMTLAAVVASKVISDTARRVLLLMITCVFFVLMASRGNNHWKNYPRTILAYAAASVMPAEAAGAVIAADTLSSMTARHIASLAYHTQAIYAKN